MCSHGLVSEAIWIKIGKKDVQPRQEHFNSSLVRRWGEYLDPTLKFLALRRWVVNTSWTLKGERGFPC